MADSLMNPAAVIGDATGISAEDFDALVVNYQRPIYRLVLSMARDPEIAASLTQDCFVRAYQSRHTFRGEASVHTWLVRIAVNLFRDEIKNRRRGFWRKIFAASGTEEHANAEARFSSPDANAERSLIAREKASEVWKIVETLSDKQREVFTLRYAEEMEMSDIAVALGMRSGTVKAHLSRAVKRVREELKRRS